MNAVQCFESGVSRSLRRLFLQRRFDMSKLKSVLTAFVLLSVFLVTPAFSDVLGGCKTGLFIGSYTNNTLANFTDVWGDGSNVVNWTIFQLNLHIDGTVTQFFTGAPDIMLSAGTETPRVGSWKCRSDGKLVVTLIWATYNPTTDAANHPLSVPNPPLVDLLLAGHTRVTYLFSVTDANTLTRTQARFRQYGPTEDPTNPNGGALQPAQPNTAVFKRVVASDADLLAP
jgi:hypothetical protein